MVDDQTSKIAWARWNAAPERSMAAIVFSNVAGLSFTAIASSSASCAAIAASRAGSKSPTFTSSNGGTPPYTPAQGAVSGCALISIFALALMTGTQPRGLDKSDHVDLRCGQSNGRVV